jgi:chemotaxis protein methyltransferase CheR
MQATDWQSFSMPMPLGPCGPATIFDVEYDQVRSLLHRKVGIALGPNKQALVCGRLFKRIQSLGLNTYGDYFSLIARPDQADELQTAVDLLTTNETYFYREHQHFEVLRGLALQAVGRSSGFKVWSAASSSGEEVYTLAMVLQCLVDEGADLRWDVMGSDVSRRMLACAARGVYTEDRVQRLPSKLLRRYCLRGTGPSRGTVLVDSALRERVRFEAINLVEPLPLLGPFDAIFLRNVLIYFDLATKRRVVQAVMATLKPGGLLFVGLAESLTGVLPRLKSVAAGVYMDESKTVQQAQKIVEEC